MQSNDIAYEALCAGHADEAIAQIEELLAQQPADPALLINLGAAYLQRGDHERAAQAYQQAVDSSTRYQLELADGTWIDSRSALAALNGRTLAAH